jgi:hypothetical protein
MAAVSGLTAGCVSLSMFQGPEVLDRGELVAGGGVTTLRVVPESSSGGIAFWPEAGIRYGLGHHLDLGVKFAGFPPFGTVYGDVRRQLTGDGVPVTAGVGGSYVAVEDSDYSFAALYPSLAVGTDRLWVAGRGILVFTGNAGEVLPAGQLWGLVAGGTLGEDVKLLPEVELYFGGDSPVIGFGLGLQFQIRSPDDDG